MYHSTKDINSAYLSAHSNQDSPLYSELLSYFFDCMRSYMIRCAQSVTPDYIIQDDIISMYHIRISLYIKNYSTDSGAPFNYCCSIINSVNLRFIEDFKRTDKRAYREKAYHRKSIELSNLPENEFSDEIIELCEEHLTSCKMDSIMRSKNPENIYIKPEVKEYLQDQIRDFDPDFYSNL